MIAQEISSLMQNKSSNQSLIVNLVPIGALMAGYLLLGPRRVEKSLWVLWLQLT